MGWVFTNARETFGQYRNLWDEINLELGNHILLDGKFVELLIQHFASTKTLVGVLKGGESSSGMVLVEPVWQGFWQTFQPSQAPLGLIVLSRRENSIESIHGLICSLPGYALQLAVLQQDPDFTQLGSVAGTEVERLNYITTSRLTMKGTFEEYWKTRSKNLVHNLARQRRRFTEQKVRLELFATRRPESIAEEIREYGRLEEAGWKAQEGTAITADNRQGFFYRDMLEHFCGRDEGVIYRLNMNGTPIASALCLERNGMLIVLKITYDEGISRGSPGLILHEEMLKLLFSEAGVSVVEYYGRYSEWHRKWTEETREMYHVNIYRFGWVGAARRFLKLTAAV